jgi:LPXTG-motif cell wall-anchored protein
MKNAGAFIALVFVSALAAAGLSVVPAHADAPLVSATGTVVSIEGDVLVLKTDTGNLTFDLDKTTEKPSAGIAVNNRITVWYDSDDKVEDRMDARRIEMAPAMTPPAARSEEETKTKTETRGEFTYDAEEPAKPAELPQTATPLALVAGAGALALAGGVFARRKR